MNTRITFVIKEFFPNQYCQYIRKITAAIKELGNRVKKGTRRLIIIN